MFHVAPAMKQQTALYVHHVGGYSKSAIKSDNSFIQNLMQQEGVESSRERTYISVQQQQYMSVLDILFLHFCGHTYSPEHAGATVNGRVDWLAAKTTVTSG